VRHVDSVILGHAGGLLMRSFMRTDGSSLLVRTLNARARVRPPASHRRALDWIDHPDRLSGERAPAGIPESAQSMLPETGSGPYRRGRAGESGCREDFFSSHPALCDFATNSKKGPIQIELQKSK
jgi:hypothetical protein